MKKRMLQNIVVSEIGMGCMAFSHGYGHRGLGGFSDKAGKIMIRDPFRIPLRQEKTVNIFDTFS